MAFIINRDDFSHLVLDESAWTWGTHRERERKREREREREHVGSWYPRFIGAQGSVLAEPGCITM